ncbi:hypothetical protein U9K52_09905 [Chryseobacterium sp. MHB01]|uniref:hypothetical protein n=1 Tax=Chryseobacterium sp. MHB01 TaxID=3109433 RepID=UPI002AFE5267|nr:hypothetical protein [Chryseobacterium sp. MHB01]MEA1849226.1 hypothetical protein [Chryseobacterium sp. MHB01]
MKPFNIIYNWKHREGHTVYENFNKEPIFANNEDEAISRFIHINPTLGQYIKKDSDGDYIYGSPSVFFQWNGHLKNHQVRAVEF